MRAEVETMRRIERKEKCVNAESVKDNNRTTRLADARGEGSPSGKCRSTVEDFPHRDTLGRYLTLTTIQEKGKDIGWD